MPRFDWHFVDQNLTRSLRPSLRHQRDRELAGCIGTQIVQNCAAMSPITQHHWIPRLGIALFLIGQAFSVAHASEFGTDHHEHNGVACFAILNDEQEGLVPAANLTASTFIAWISAAPQSARPAPLKRQHSIRPPPTGPPSI